MPGNNSIQFLRGTQEKINSHSTEVLNSGQPLYNISDESLVIGDGVRPINLMNKLKNIHQLGLSDSYLSLNYLRDNSIDIRGYTIFFNTNVVPSTTISISVSVMLLWDANTETLTIRVDGEDTTLYSNGQWVLDRYTVPVELSLQQLIPPASVMPPDTSIVLGMRYYGEHEMTPTEVNDVWQGLPVASGDTIALGDKIISAPDMSGKMATQEWVESYVPSLIDTSNFAQLNKNNNTFQGEVVAQNFYASSGYSNLYVDYEEVTITNDDSGSALSMRDDGFWYTSSGDGDTYTVNFPDDSGTIALEETIAGKLFNWDDSYEVLTIYVN